jgi:hypothetical protein
MNIMKRTILSKTLLSAAAMLFILLTCDGKNPQADQLVGTWTKTFDGRVITFTIASDQTYQTEFAGDDKVDVWGSYVISGTQVTFTDEGGDYSADVPGVYEFKVNETSVSFTEVNDPVFGRRTVMEGTWSKAENP